MSMPMRMLVALAVAAPAIALAQATPPAGAPPAAAAAGARAPAQLLSAIDADWARRDEPGKLADERARLDEAARVAPDDYEVLWREARLYFWLADDPAIDGKEKSRLGKIGWDWGDRATAANPGRVEGWHYAAAGVGNYGLGIGVLTALKQGIEGKFKERLSRAESIDPGFQNGGIQTAWGRFYYELPWPKYSPQNSRKYLEAALKKNPANVRAHVYLADLWKKEDRPDLARTELAAALSAPPGRYDAPEERRWQAIAKKKLDER
jgi:hypothetical protein